MNTVYTVYGAVTHYLNNIPDCPSGVGGYIIQKGVSNGRDRRSTPRTLEPKPRRTMMGILLVTGFAISTDYTNEDEAFNDAAQIAARGTAYVLGVEIAIDHIIVSVAHVWSRGDAGDHIELKGGDPSVRSN